MDDLGVAAYSPIVPPFMETPIEFQRALKCCSPAFPRIPSKDRRDDLRDVDQPAPLLHRGQRLGCCAWEDHGRIWEDGDGLAW